MKFKVILWEFERGWGSRPDDEKVFDSADYNGDADAALAAAKAYRAEFNSHNTETTAPDWYMVAGEPFMVKE